MKRFVAAVVVAASVSAGASTALAGEVNGIGEPLPSKDVARSDCVFSGLEDDDGGPNGGPGVAPQTYGQIVKGTQGLPRYIGGADGPHESPFGTIIGCNASLYPINVDE